MWPPWHEVVVREAKNLDAGQFLEQRIDEHGANPAYSLCGDSEDVFLKKQASLCNLRQ
jgi:hypothetical protein